MMNDEQRQPENEKLGRGGIKPLGKLFRPFTPAVNGFFRDYKANTGGRGDENLQGRRPETETPALREISQNSNTGLFDFPLSPLDDLDELDALLPPDPDLDILDDLLATPDPAPKPKGDEKDARP